MPFVIRRGKGSQNIDALDDVWQLIDYARMLEKQVRKLGVRYPAKDYKIRKHRVRNEDQRIQLP